MKFSRIVGIFSKITPRNHGRPDEAEPSSSAGTQAGPPAAEDRAESPEVTAGEAGTPIGPPLAGDAGAHHAETSAVGAARTPTGPPPGTARTHHAETFTAGASRTRNTLNNPAEFSFLQLQRATNNFSRQQLIRKGIYAHVFRGRFETGEIVAVKRLNRYEDMNEDYNQEIDILTRLPRHPNIIDLVGFCAEGDKRIIVYEFMPFGSLRDHLTRTKLFDPCLDWNARMRIAADVADGLYHVETHETRPRYDDLKPCHVLIDYGFHAKLSIFGRADWFTSNAYTSNAYKFGLVLLEIITGKEPEDFSRGRYPTPGYLELSSKFTKEKKLVKLADRKMKGQFPVDMLKKALELVLVCTNLDLSSMTLKMTVVVQAMHYLTSDPNAMVRWPWAENNPVVFTLHPLQGAINNFTSDKRGGSPLVSEGRLQSGQLVAIKRLEHENMKMVYDLEVHTLTRLRHPNIINLIGYCAEGEERYFVYEFMHLGSLLDQLHARKPEEGPLDWSARMKIGAGIANALNHLHDKARPRLIYGDLKPSNILLANGLIPKLSGFGIAKSALFGNQSSPPTTSPYWAPERALTGRLTFKSDVYNFGMVLLEIITGCADKSYIPAWVRREDRCIELAADPELNGQFSADMVMKALEVVSRCVDEDPDSRPNMSDVLGAMKYLASSCDDDPGEMAWPVEFDLLPGVQLE